MTCIKKIAAMLSAITLAVSLTGCGYKYDSIDNTEILELPSLPDYSQYVELGEYKGIEYTLLNDYSVTDEYIQYGIETLLYNVASYKNVSGRGAKIGDLVTIRFEGTVDGKTFKGGSSGEDGTAIFLGYGNLLEGFEEQLIGLKDGATTKITIKFPNNYSKINLRGKDVVFNVEILNIQERILPEITDQLISENTVYKSVEEITEAVKTTLAMNELYQRNAEIYDTVFSKITENSTIKGYPEDLLQSLIDTTINSTKTSASQNGMSVDNYVKDTYGEASFDDYKEHVKENAKEFLVQRMIMSEIARKEGISATAEEFTEYKKSYAKENGYMNIDDVNIYYSDEEILLDCSLAKIEDWIIGNSVEKK